MLRIVFISVCVIFKSVAPVDAALDAVIPLTKPWLDPRPSERSVPKVEESIRVKMIAELHEASRNVGVKLHYGQSSIDILLIDLGDEVTINQYLEDRFGPNERRNASSVLFASRQPSLIAALGPFLLREEPAELKDVGGQLLVPRSLAACQLCLTLIQNCADFEEPARKWAAALQSRSRNRATMRDEVRAFWRENMELLKTKNYQAVRPPSSATAYPPRAQPVTSRPNAAPALPIAAPVSTNSPPAERVSIPPAPSAPATPATSKSAPTTSAPPASGDDSAPPPAWPWLLGVGGILAAFLWRRSH